MEKVQPIKNIHDIERIKLHLKESNKRNYLLFVIGITALICNVPFESKFLIDTAIAIFSGALLWLGTYKHKELRKPCGIVMLICYAAYFVYLCVL